MTFVEAAEKAPQTRRLQVFATDLNEALLDQARYGLYAKSLVQVLTSRRVICRNSSRLYSRSVRKQPR